MKTCSPFSRRSDYADSKPPSFLITKLVEAGSRHNRERGMMAQVVEA